MHRRREEIRESIFGTATVEKSIVVGIGIVLYVVDPSKSLWIPPKRGFSTESGARRRSLGALGSMTWRGVGRGGTATDRGFP